VQLLAVVARWDPPRPRMRSLTRSHVRAAVFELLVQREAQAEAQRRRAEYQVPMLIMIRTADGMTRNIGGAQSLILIMIYLDNGQQRPEEGIAAPLLSGLVLEQPCPRVCVFVSDTGAGGRRGGAPPTVRGLSVAAMRALADIHCRHRWRRPVRAHVKQYWYCALLSGAAAAAASEPSPSALAGFGELKVTQTYPCPPLACPYIQHALPSYGCGSLSRSLLSSLGWHCMCGMCCACSFEQHLIATRSWSSWIWPTRRCETRLSRRCMWVISLFL
jgi:hypothetical protein